MDNDFWFGLGLRLRLDNLYFPYQWPKRGYTNSNSSIMHIRHPLILEVKKEIKKSIYLSKINLLITINKKLVKSQSLINVGFKSFFICILERRVLLLHKLHDVSWRASKIYQWCRKIKLLRKSILKKSFWFITVKWN